MQQKESHMDFPHDDDDENQRRRKTEHNPDSHHKGLGSNRQAPQQELPEEPQQQLLHGATRGVEYRFCSPGSWLSRCLKNIKDKNKTAQEDLEQYHNKT